MSVETSGVGAKHHISVGVLLKAPRDPDEAIVSG